MFREGIQDHILYKNSIESELTQQKVIWKVTWVNALSPSINHFTVVYSVTRPIKGSEAAGDFVLIQTSLLFLCKCRLVNITTT